MPVHHLIMEMCYMIINTLKVYSIGMATLKKNLNRPSVATFSQKDFQIWRVPVNSSLFNIFNLNYRIQLLKPLEIIDWEDNKIDIEFLLKTFFNKIIVFENIG